MSVFRLTGRVDGLDDRAWSSKDGSRSGTIKTASIRVNDFVVTEVTIADAMVGKISQGADVDLVIDVQASGNYLRSTAINFWPRETVQTSLNLNAVKSA